MAFISNKTGSLEYMTSDILSDIAVHAFTTRYGGVSTGIFESLNLGVNRGDDRKSVLENYNIICSAVGTIRERLVFSHQVHENNVRAVTSRDSLVDIFSPVPYDADGLVTDEPGLPLVIFTADCIPVLLCDEETGAVGAVHAGWRGTAAGIAGLAVQKMRKEYGCCPENIRAAVGPGIGQCCFETGADVPEALREAMGSKADKFIKSCGGKFMVDLKGANCEILLQEGLSFENIDISDECTMCCCEKYWSHRKTAGKRGSQASMIMRTVG